jgi:hypothetical protein
MVLFYENTCGRTKNVGSVRFEILILRKNFFSYFFRIVYCLLHIKKKESSTTKKSKKREEENDVAHYLI